jgi:hypothetical protein
LVEHAGDLSLQTGRAGFDLKVAIIEHFVPVVDPDKIPSLAAA